MPERRQRFRQSDKQELCVQMLIEKAAAGSERHRRAMVAAHAVDGQRDHGFARRDGAWRQ